ncbi:MAG: putative addiction module CopG family antidote [Parasphingorhabdus sp.]|jgi:putative addiction module CopG family antidote
MNISLTRELEDYIKDQVKTGHYKSNSEVIREALRGKIHTEMENRLDQRLAVSMQQVANGETVLADDEYFERKRQMIREKYMSKDA